MIGAKSILHWVQSVARVQASGQLLSACFLAIYWWVYSFPLLFGHQPWKISVILKIGLALLMGVLVMVLEEKLWASASTEFIKKLLKVLAIASWSWVKITFTLSSGSFVLRSLFLPVNLLRFFQISFPFPLVSSITLIKTVSCSLLYVLYYLISKGCKKYAIITDLSALLSAKSCSFICLSRASLSVLSSRFVLHLPCKGEHYLTDNCQKMYCSCSQCRHWTDWIGQFQNDSFH